MHECLYYSFESDSASAYADVLGSSWESHVGRVHLHDCVSACFTRAFSSACLLLLLAAFSVWTLMT